MSCAYFEDIKDYFMFLKGLKDKSISNVDNFRFVVPTLEYHNQTWTYLDLLMAMKADCKKVLISQVRFPYLAGFKQNTT